MKSFRFLNQYAIPIIAGIGMTVGLATAQVPVPHPGATIDLIPSLKGTPVPLPAALDTVIKDRAKAIALGKALFWDKQAGSDGQACASCHFHAGADNRSKNQLSPGLRQVPSDTTFSVLPGGGGGVNYQMKLSDFPLHRLSDILDRNSDIIFTTNDVFSSQGTFGGTFVQFFGINNEKCTPESSPIFHVGGKLARKVEPRNTPTMINAVFQFRTFWDGRANNHFNGVNPFGLRDPGAKILATYDNVTAVPEMIDLRTRRWPRKRWALRAATSKWPARTAPSSRSAARC